MNVDDTSAVTGFAMHRFFFSNFALCPNRKVIGDGDPLRGNLVGDAGGVLEVKTLRGERHAVVAQAQKPASS